MAPNESIPLSDLIELKYGKGLPERNRIEGPYAVYGSNGIVGRHDSFLLDTRTIVLGRKGSVGEITLTEEHSWPIDTTYYVEIKDTNRLNLKYLYFFLKTLNLKALDTSSTIPGLNRNYVLELKIPLPPVGTQEKIVAVLAKIDGLRQKREKTNHITRKILHAVFLQMFGDPFTNPLNFPTAKIQECVELVNGKAFKSSDWSDSGLKIIRIQNLNNPHAKFNYYSKEIEDRYIVNKGDLLLSWSGTPGTSFGAFVWNGEKAVLNQHIFNVKTKLKNINKHFFRYFINSKLSELIWKAHGGVGLQHITKSELNGIDVLIPPVDLQGRFSSIVERLEALGQKQAQSTRWISALFDSLLSKAFMGELAQDIHEIEASQQTLSNHAH